VALFDRNEPQPLEQPAAAELEADWSDIGAIRAEWPRAALNAQGDLQGFHQALGLFERDDYASMKTCATLFATALAHSLYGPGILKGNELPDTVHKALYTALCAPPDGRTFADSAKKAARLAMTVMRENHWQPPSFGGTVTHFEPMMMDKGNYGLLSAAIAPQGRPWEGDLEAFFAVAPEPTIGLMPDVEADRVLETVVRLDNTIQESKAGDLVSSLYVEGMALELQGDNEAALGKYSEAAALGSVDAMASAGDVCGSLGMLEDARFWYENAANVGHPVGMFNMGIDAIHKGDLATARQWFQRSAEGGNAEGYAALTQLADEAGDIVAETHWSRLGAEAGHLFCIGRHGLLLARDADGDVPTLRRARDFLDQAAERGDIDAAVLGVTVSHQLSDPTWAQRFVALVVQSGDSEATDRLRRYGYL
jgi:TPR repeat protein